MAGRRLDGYRLDAVGLVASCAIATALCFSSNNLAPRVAHRAEIVDQQLALLEARPLMFDGQPLDMSEFRNRVLFPAVMRSMVAAGVGSPAEVFLGLRLVTAAAALFGLWIFATRLADASADVALLALSMLGWVLLLTFNNPWENPTDFPDALFTIAWAAAALRGRFAVTAVVVAVGTLNRESTAFAGVLWVLLHATRAPRWRDRATHAAAGFVLAAGALLLTSVWRSRWGLPDTDLANSLGITLMGPMIAAALRQPVLSWIQLLAAAFGLPILWLWLHRRARTHEAGALLLAAVAMAGASAIIGLFNEVRIFIPTLTLLILAGLLRVQAERSEPPERSERSERSNPSQK
jgi:hypothetical protein